MGGNGREGSEADREPAGTRFRRQIGGLSTDVRRPADGSEGGREATGEPKSGDGLDSEDRQGGRARRCIGWQIVERNASTRRITRNFSPERELMLPNESTDSL